MTEQPIPCVIYGCKSSPDEKESVADQHRQVLAAIEKEGGRRLVAPPFGEANASGYRGERGAQLDAAMRAAIDVAAEHGDAELWVFHSSRLARGDGRKGRRSIQLVIAQLLYENVTVRSVADPPFVTPMLAGIGSEAAHKYSADLSAHTKRGLRQRKEAGKPIGGVPYGYTVDRQIVDGKVISTRVIDPTASATVCEIATLVENGVTPGDVGRALNARGVLTQRGGVWTREAVARVVRHRAYLGENGYPALLDAERWQAANDQLKRTDPSSQQRRQGGRPPTADFILHGLAFCRSCGSPLYTRVDGGRRRYVCRLKRRGTGLCSAPAVPAELAERHVLGHLDVFVGDVEKWLGEQVTSREREHQQRLAGLSRKQAGLVKLDRQRERHLAEYRRLVDEGSSVAHLALEVVAALDRERDQQQEAIGMAEAVAGEWSGTPDLDSMLDFYARLVDLVRGKVSAATEAKALNATLASVIAGVWLEIDGDRLRAEFRLNTAMFIDPADAENSVLATGFTLHPVADHQITRPLAWLAKPTDQLPSRSCPPA